MNKVESGHNKPTEHQAARAGGLMTLLECISAKKLGSDIGYVFRAQDGMPVLSTDKELDDLAEQKFKWKIGVSTESGCRVGCKYCFTNLFKHYRPLRAEEIVEQVHEVMARHQFPTRQYDEIKVELKEMGDPTCNPRNVCDALKQLYLDHPTYTYVVSTSGVRNPLLFEELKKVRDLGAAIRLTFSCHTTSNEDRIRLSPKLKMMTLEEIADTITSWYDEKTKVSLNFVPMDGYELSAEKLAAIFDKEKVFIKISYLDPNPMLDKNNITSKLQEDIDLFVRGLEHHGFTYAYRNERAKSHYKESVP